MLLALNGATTMKAMLPEDIAATSAAGFKALVIWAAKVELFRPEYWERDPGELATAARAAASATVGAHFKIQ
jgi:hypothetical protein